MASADNLPAVRYVASKEGLNQRESASVSSRKIGTLLYGSRVIVVEKSIERVTIDGITDHWYRCQGRERSWVFGGYLSTTMPDDTDSVLGYWNTDRGERYYWYFHPDHTVSSGRKETDVGWKGNWVLSENKLIINITITEFHTGESEVLDITVTVINRDRIILNFSNGNKEELVRNNSII